MENNTIKGLVIDQSDYKQLKEEIENSLFQMSLYGLSGDTLYPKKDSYKKLYEIIFYGCTQASNTHNFADSIKAVCGEASRIEAAIGKALGRDGISTTAKTIYSIITSRCFKQFGDFI